MRAQRNRNRADNKLTILNLAHARLEIIQGQVADLVLQAREIHDGDDDDEELLASRATCA